MPWKRTTVGDHPCDIFEPEKQPVDRFAVLYLHDQPRLAPGDLRICTPMFEQHGLRVIAPWTGQSWWTDRIWPAFDSAQSIEQYLRTQVLDWIASEWEIRPPAIALLGIGMGGQGALRASFKSPNLFPIVAAISPAIDCYTIWYDDDTLLQVYSDPENARQDSATLHIHPLNWPRNTWLCADPADHDWHESAERLRMKLTALGIPHEQDLETTTGGNREKYLEKMLPGALGFITQRLGQEARRVR
ncbi:MAG: alpha/beta hydrolase-fold protein [Planctomycetota bacterium]|nr:alpha/beta hydrolase-fold protein [Planctomycetota bacterium]